MDLSKCGIDGLMKALAIFRKYGNPTSPTHCEHDKMYVMIRPDWVSDEDKVKLNELGFNEGDDGEAFTSFRFGSA
jgi:hypothetical protein